MYRSFFGLREEPFRLSPDPRFLHLADPHQKALVALLGGVMQRKALLLLTGPIGTGKTTLLHAMLAIVRHRYSPKQVATAFIVNPVLSRAEFLETLMIGFGLTGTAPTRPRQLLAIQQMLMHVQRRGSVAVLLIDEAHLLGLELLEEVRLLSNIQLGQGEERPLQIVLGAQPELLGMLDTPQLAALNQRIAVRSQLRPLTLSETCAYVVKRLQAAGLNGSAPFPAPVVAEVFRLSRGIPRLINLLCDSCLQIACQKGRRQVGLDIVRDVAASLLPAEIGDCATR